MHRGKGDEREKRGKMKVSEYKDEEMSWRAQSEREKENTARRLWRESNSRQQREESNAGFTVWYFRMQ